MKNRTAAVAASILVMSAAGATSTMAHESDAELPSLSVIADNMESNSVCMSAGTFYSFAGFARIGPGSWQVYARLDFALSPVTITVTILDSGVGILRCAYDGAVALTEMVGLDPVLERSLVPPQDVPNVSVAQEDGLRIWRTSACSSCHGGFADGGGEGEQPDGPSLRQYTQDRDAMWETIACGRGDMPYHLEGAYVEVACYGIPLGESAPAGFTAGRLISGEQLDALLDFLFEHVVGVPLTRQACAVYFGGNADSPACAAYPDAP